MATFHDLTVSNIVELADPEAVEAIVDEYYPHPDVSVTDGKLDISGYQSMIVNESTAHSEDITTEMLNRISPHLAEGEELIIQTIGHEKLRYPICAYQYTVTPEGVLQDSLGKTPTEV